MTSPLSYANITAESTLNQHQFNSEETMDQEIYQERPTNILQTSTPAAVVVEDAGKQSGIPSQTQRNNNSPNSYVPSKKAAIVLENTQEVTQDQCLRAVADIIAGKNIHYVTRLSGARICMYLTDESYVNKMCLEGGVTIGSLFITIRRYVTEATKFVISNCPPELSDEELKSLMQPYGKIVSAPSRLRVTTAHEDLRHIKSWRRSIFIIVPNDGPEIPKRLLITNKNDGNKQTLYIDRDEIVCTFCSAPGHSVDKCKRKELQEKEFPSFAPPAGHRLFNHSISKPQDRRRRISTPDNINPETNDFLPQFSKPQVVASNSNEPTSSGTSANPSTVSGIWDNPPNNDNREELQRLIESNLMSRPLIGLQNVRPEESTQQEASESCTDFSQSYNFSTPTLLPGISSEKKRPCSPDKQLQQETKIPKFKLSMKNLAPGPIHLSTPIETSDSEFGEMSTSSLDGDPTADLGDNEEDFSHEETMNQSPLTKKQKKNKKVQQKQELDYVIQQMVFDPQKLTKQQFSSFLDKCRGKANSKKTAELYHIDKPELVRHLDRAAIITTNFNLQRRLERASAALKETDE